MSSVLNVPNGSSKSEEFNLNDIEVLVDSEEQNCFKRAHVRKFLSLKHIDTPEGGLDKCEMATRNDIGSQKDKGKAIKKHILKDFVPRGLDARIEEIQGKHQQVITRRDNQMQALEFTNEKHQQKILRLNKEINDDIAERHVAAVDVLTTCCVSSNRIAERFSYITLFDVSTDSLKNISDGLNFVTQEWRCLSNVMIQMPFTYGTGSSKK